MKQLALLVYFIFWTADAVNVTLSASKWPIRKLSRKFLSIGLDSSMIREHWCGIDWRKATILGKELRPAYLRFGGNDADRLIYEPRSNSYHEIAYHDEHCSACYKKADPSNFTMNGAQFQRLNWFANISEWSLIFDLNALLRDRKNRWDPSNAIQILSLADRKKFKLEFELGNEPNDWKHKFNRTVSPKQLGKDFRRARKLLARFPSFKRSFLIGPSISQPKNKRRVQFLRRFLKVARKSIDAVTFHQYYVNGRTAVAAQFMNSTIFDDLLEEIRVVVRLVKQLALAVKGRGKLEIWLGETGSAYGGGAPGLSDSYIAGFMWMDKLGLGAREGLDIIIRQSFFHGHYALVDDMTYPNPDYWLSLLYKRIVFPEVLLVNQSVDNVDYSGNIRFYAHSNKTHVTYYGMNLGDEWAEIRFSDIEKGDIVQYLFEPLNGVLTSKVVLLNGVALSFDGNRVPNLESEGKLVKKIVLPPNRFAFYVVDKLSNYLHEQ